MVGSARTTAVGTTLSATADITPGDSEALTAGGIIEIQEQETTMAATNSFCRSGAAALGQAKMAAERVTKASVGFALLMSWGAHVPHVEAATIKSAYVLAEDQGSSGEKCGLSREGETSAVQAALRQNGIDVIYDRSKGYGKPVFYLNTTSLVTATGGCVVFTRLDVHIFDVVKIPESNKTYYANIVFCEGGDISTGPPYDYQERVSSFYQNFVNECISEIEKGASESLFNDEQAPPEPRPRKKKSSN